MLHDAYLSFNYMIIITDFPFVIFPLIRKILGLGYLCYIGTINYILPKNHTKLLKRGKINKQIFGLVM